MIEWLMWMRLNLCYNKEQHEWGGYIYGYNGNNNANVEDYFVVFGFILFITQILLQIMR